MKKITYSPHLEFRLKVRGISKLLPKRIFQTAKEHYFDTLTRKNIAVKKARYKNKFREIAVIYEELGSQIILITVHPLKTFQKKRRIKSKRWQKILKEKG